MSKIRVTVTKETRCPACGAKLNAATPTDLSAHTLKPGDVSICVACYQPLVYTDEYDVRALTTEEFAALPQNLRDEYDAIVTHARAEEAREEERRARS